MTNVTFKAIGATVYVEVEKDVIVIHCETSQDDGEMGPGYDIRLNVNKYNGVLWCRKRLGFDPKVIVKVTSR